MCTLRLLEAIRLLGLEKNAYFYQATTSDLFGLVQYKGAGPNTYSGAKPGVDLDNKGERYLYIIEDSKTTADGNMATGPDVDI